MSYFMYQIGGDFTIPSSKKQMAFDLLKKWELNEFDSKVDRYHISSRYENHPVNNAESLEDAFSEYDWEAETDDAGNITGICFVGEKLIDEDAWLSAIAPAVRKGSKLMMVGENGYNWCWYFDGTTCTEYFGEVIYPNVPKSTEE